MNSYEFDVALSFAGEDREFSHSIALALEDSNYVVFYDDFESARLWGTELSVSLAQIYERSARHCIIIVSEYYAAKQWTNHERRFAIQRALSTRLDYILPIRVDNAELPGWPSTIAYQNTEKQSLPDLLQVIFSKLGRPQATRPVRVPTQDCGVGQEIIRACFRRSLFTRMDSEIGLSAMSHSIGECIGQVQRLVPRLEMPELQSLGVRLLEVLDDIQRRTASDVGVSNRLANDEKLAIDGSKLEAIQLLKHLRRVIGATIKFPASLSYDHFFGIDEGNQPPIANNIQGNLTVASHFEQVSQERNERIKHTPLRCPAGLSPLGVACLLAYEVATGASNQIGKHEIQSLLKTHIREENVVGKCGDEAVFHQVRRFPSGAIVGLVICRPGCAEEAFAIVVDDKFPTYFGILHQEFESVSSAQDEVFALCKLDGRGEELAESIASRGWTHLRFL